MFTCFVGQKEAKKKNRLSNKIAHKNTWTTTTFVVFCV